MFHVLLTIFQKLRKPGINFDKINMYAAHAEQTRKNTSRQNVEKCLTRVKQDSSDSETFETLLMISDHVRSNRFTDEDRRTILEAVGFEFLLKLLKSDTYQQNLPENFYKSAVLSFLAAWTVDTCVTKHPAIKIFLPLVNDVFSPNSQYNQNSNRDLPSVCEQMCRDCEEIVANLTKCEKSVDYLVQSKTLQIMVKYATSPVCQDILLVLGSLSSVVKTRGESAIDLDPDTFDDIMRVIVIWLGKGSDMKFKIELVRILSAFLSGVVTMEVSVKTDWVTKLTKALKKLIIVKIPPEDTQAVLDLLGALVSTAGPQIMSSEVAGDYNLLKSVVARVSVEVYILLDNIDISNASSRYSQLDTIYKLLSNIVQFVAETGDSMDADSVIVVYRKLVEISEVIMEFLYSVANQEIGLPRNHIVVLISVRTLAAMLSEITEEVTPRLLELLPFFNLLCQNVEYSGDVVMEVKNATQAALANIKAIKFDDGNEETPTAEHEQATNPLTLSPTQNDTPDIPQPDLLNTSNNICEGNIHNLEMSSKLLDPYKLAANDFDSLQITDLTSCEIATTGNKIDTQLLGCSEITQKSSEINYFPVSIDSKQGSVFKESASLSEVSGHDTECNLPENSLNNQNNSSCIPEHEKSFQQNHSGIHLTQDNFDKLRTFQALVAASSSAKLQSFSTIKVSFIPKSKNRQNCTNDQAALDQSEQWKPMPDDILGYLLPAYICLLDNEEVLEVMTQNYTFQTIIRFLETSLSHFLENKSSSLPESTTVNALSLIEQVYTNSPATASRLGCFQELFEISLLSLPNLLTMPHPPDSVCLKLLELFLSSYRLQMTNDNKKSSLPRLKHSQIRLFKAGIDYLSSFYEFRQRKGRPLSLFVKDNWPLAEVTWCSCIAVLCNLMKFVDELRDVLAKSKMLPEFLSYLASADDWQSYSHNVKQVTESMVLLIETAAASSNTLQGLIVQNQGPLIARKFGLHKLEKCLQKLPQQPS